MASSNVYRCKHTYPKEEHILTCSLLSRLYQRPLISLVSMNKLVGQDGFMDQLGQV
jgi:hypothetical protein